MNYYSPPPKRRFDPSSWKWWLAMVPLAAALTLMGMLIVDIISVSGK